MEDEARSSEKENRILSGEWDLEKEIAASDEVGDLNLELREEEKLFPEVTDVFEGEGLVSNPSEEKSTEYDGPVGDTDQQPDDLLEVQKSDNEDVREDNEQNDPEQYEDEQNEDDPVGEEEYNEEEEHMVEEDEVEPAPEEPRQSSSIQGMSDFDMMMQRKKESLQRARQRKRKNYDVTTNDDAIMALLDRMRKAASEDKQLNLAQKAATKKLKLLPTVVVQLNRSELRHAFVECGVLSVLTEWLRPLPDHSLPHIQIREAILSILHNFPSLESGILKSSGIGKMVMLLYRHPKETRKNKEKAGKIINEWARPIFGLTSDYKTLSREERESRDYEHLSQAARRRLSSTGESSGNKTTADDQSGPQKPGDKGWVGRARVPLPSHKDYVVRPKSKVVLDSVKAPIKKTPGRYEKHMQKVKDYKASSNRNKMHAATLSLEGRGML